MQTSVNVSHRNNDAARTCKGQPGENSGPTVPFHNAPQTGSSASIADATAPNAIVTLLIQLVNLKGQSAARPCRTSAYTDRRLRPPKRY